MIALPQRQRIAAYALIECADFIVLSLASKGTFTGTWNFPGGAIEFGEDPMAGLLREVFEETELRLHADEFRLFTTTSTRTTWTDREDRLPEAELHNVGIVYRARLAERLEVKSDSDGLSSAECRWFSLDQIRSGTIPLNPNVLRVLALDKSV